VETTIRVGIPDEGASLDGVEQRLAEALQGDGQELLLAARVVQVKPIEIGGRLVRHARPLVFQLAQLAVPKEVFQGVAASRAAAGWMVMAETG
jgi:hypothetical protein